MHDHSSLISYVEQDLLCGDAVFPTCFRLTLAIREALAQPNLQISSLAKLIECEPLLVSKLVQMANCITFNPFGRTVYGAEQAIQRVGLNATRTLSIAIAVEQLKLYPSMKPYETLADAAWERSVHVAALLRELAKLGGKVSADEAMLCGLVSEMGRFYLLFRAGHVPLYKNDFSLLIDLLQRYSRIVSVPLVASLGVPNDIVHALSPEPAAAGSRARQLQELLTEARRIEALPDPVPVDEPRADWLLAVQQQVAELRNSL